MEKDRLISYIENFPELRRQLTEHLVMMRDTFKDEIPVELVHSDSPDNKYKVRKNWFAGIVGAFENAVTSGLVRNADLVTQINEFIDDHVEQARIGKPSLTTKEDIDRANLLINAVLENIK